MRRLFPYKLWLGHAGDARSYRQLFDEGIRAIVLLAREEAPESAPRDLIVIRVPLLDGAGNDPALVQLTISTVASLIESQIDTLVTCGAGMSRSPAIVAAAIAFGEGSDPNLSLARVADGFPTDVSPSLWHQITQVLKSRGDSLAER